MPTVSKGNGLVSKRDSHRVCARRAICGGNNDTRGHGSVKAQMKDTMSKVEN